MQRYALVSDKQRRAVVSFAGKRFDGCWKGKLATWRKIFINAGVEEIDLSNRKSNDCHSPDIVALLKEPTLRKGTITDHPDLLQAASRSSVVDLTVLLQMKRNPQAILKMLRTLRLEKLVIQCKPRAEESCYIGNEHRQALNPAALSALCPPLNTECIKVRCVCEIRNLVWYPLTHASRLDAIVLKAPPSDHLVHWLSRLYSVTLFASCSAVPGLATNYRSLGSDFAGTISELWHGDFLSTEEVRDLPAFPNMKKLACKIQPEAIVALAEVCRNSPFLHTLHLTWKSKCQDDLDANVKNRPVLTLVQGIPMLENVLFSQATISTTELREIMMFMGSRLKRLETRSDFLGEDMSDRIFTILETAVEFNHNLRSLHLQKTYVTVECKMAERTEVEKAKALLSRMSIRQPGFLWAGFPFPNRYGR